jgi:hypothetical protein
MIGDYLKKAVKSHVEVIQELEEAGYIVHSEKSFAKELEKARADVREKTVLELKDFLANGLNSQEYFLGLKETLIPFIEQAKEQGWNACLKEIEDYLVPEVKLAERNLKLGKPEFKEVLEQDLGNLLEFRKLIRKMREDFEGLKKKAKE